MQGRFKIGSPWDLWRREEQRRCDGMIIGGVPEEFLNAADLSLH
jgi:hypothetical protein